MKKENIMTRQLNIIKIDEVKKAKELFAEDSGIILGPSHYITADTPLENILAIYNCSSIL